MPLLDRWDRRCAAAIWLSPLLLLSFSPILAVCRGDFDEIIDSPMYKSPDLAAPRREIVFPEEARALWLKALQRPEADMKCKAAESITRAKLRGVQGLEATIAPLLEEFDRPEQHAAVRLAIAQALIALEARQTAPTLLRHAQSGPGDLREAVEPALARWKYQPAAAMWLARLEDPKAAPHSLTLAIRGLTALSEVQAEERLRQLALADRTDRSVRAEAGRALGVLRQQGLEKDAEVLLTEPPARGYVPRLVAAALLRQHRGDPAVRLLQRLAADEEPAVAAVALARLVELDTQLVVPLLDRLLASPDAKLRLYAVEVLCRQPNDKHIRLLGDRLDDPHTEVRVKACRSLLALAERKEFRDAVIQHGERLLTASDWRGQEQATILLTQLDRKSVGGRLVELLSSRRPEVFVTAAWGLRRLAVPETLPGVLRHIEAEEPRLRAMAGNPDMAAVVLDHKLSQLNQLLGQQKYAAADAALRQFIPRMETGMQPPVGQESRAAAIWALGLIHENQADSALAMALEQRLNDFSTLPPEDLRVRSMAAISIGRLKAKQCLASLRTYFPEHVPPRSLLNSSCGWAIEQMTGEIMPPPKPIRAVERDWFLVPDR
jgi:HEAT repeat protein